MKERGFTAPLMTAHISRAADQRIHAPNLTNT
jgi:hypothetical protein